MSFSLKHYLFRQVLLASFFLSNQLIAGELIIQNASGKNLLCQIDGYSLPLQVRPNSKFSLTPNKTSSSIHWVACNGLKQGNINISPSSSNHWFIFNGKAKDVLNVLLYPSIPTYPYGNFSTLTKKMTEEFQALHPEVLINIVISTDPALDTYTFANLPNILGSEGFDLVELDTMLLGEVVRHGLVTPVELNPNIFLPAAYQAATYNHLSYGVPSRLCAYYLFSHDKNIVNNSQSLDSLIAYLHKLPKDRTSLIGDFNGSWNLPSFYLQSYASNHGYSNLDQLLSSANDQLSVGSISTLAAECGFEEDNKCINKYYHKQPVSALGEDFANGKAYNYLAFSEAAFYIKKNSSANLYANLIPYGSNFNPLVYTDVYVKNAATCKDKICDLNYKNFTDYMNKTSTQLWINFSEDLQPNMPPRYLLSAIKKFYDDPRVKADALYANFAKNLASVIAYPNNVSEEEHTLSNNDICTNLQALMPDYQC